MVKESDLNHQTYLMGSARVGSNPASGFLFFPGIHVFCFVLPADALTGQDSFNPLQYVLSPPSQLYLIIPCISICLSSSSPSLLAPPDAIASRPALPFEPVLFPSVNRHDLTSTLNNDRYNLMAIAPMK